MSALQGATPITFIHARDRTVSVAFYRDVLGLPVTKDDGFATVLDLAGVALRITEIKDHVPNPHTVLGWRVQDVAATLAALKAAGVTFLIYPGFGQDNDGVWTSPDGAAKVAWFNDPDGNNLSITQA
jgi:catechol 2,3-dioxygenase-like lactoylglutathione lyase family enzyme